MLLPILPSTSKDTNLRSASAIFWRLSASILCSFASTSNEVAEKNRLHVVGNILPARRERPNMIHVDETLLLRMVLSWFVSQYSTFHSLTQQRRGSFILWFLCLFLRDLAAIYVSRKLNMVDCSSGKVGKGAMDNTPGVADRELRCRKDIDEVDYICKLRGWFI